MNLENRLQTQYAWTSSFRTVYKKPAPQGFKVPQTSGISGWIVLSYEKNVPVCTWISRQETVQLSTVFDERFFGDTIFRVEKLNDVYIVSDVLFYNSNYIFATTTFKQRYEWLEKILNKFHSHIEGLAKFVHKSNLPKCSLKGYEIYNNIEGSFGFFVEQDKKLIKKSDIPDVYLIEDSYLRVPNLKTSVYLRSLGDEFELKCAQESDGSWSVQENIPDL